MQVQTQVVFPPTQDIILTSDDAKWLIASAFSNISKCTTQIGIGNNVALKFLFTFNHSNASKIGYQNTFSITQNSLF